QPWASTITSTSSGKNASLTREAPDGAHPLKRRPLWASAPQTLLSSRLRRLGERAHAGITRRGRAILENKAGDIIAVGGGGIIHYRIIVGQHVRGDNAPGAHIDELDIDIVAIAVAGAEERIGRS